MYSRIVNKEVREIYTQKMNDRSGWCVKRCVKRESDCFRMKLSVRASIKRSEREKVKGPY